jgi:olfactory receptor
MENSTEVTEFILVGLLDDPELQTLLFIMFLIYLSNLAGNLGISGLILLDSHLHAPKYFFLNNLSMVDIGYTSAVTPNVMEGLLTREKFISLNACIIQFFFFGGFVIVESFLLSSMAYDCYAAVCKLLHYTTIITTNMCVCLTMGAYICGFLNAAIYPGNIFMLSFCKSNVVDIL